MKLKVNIVIFSKLTHTNKIFGYRGNKKEIIQFQN